jgi:hypothetical protein
MNSSIVLVAYCGRSTCIVELFDNKINVKMV